METLVRFFLSAEEECVAQAKYNGAVVIPYKGATVLLDDILNENEENNLLDYDYYTVKSVEYSYDYNIVLVDIIVEGNYDYE